MKESNKPPARYLHPLISWGVLAGVLGLVILVFGVAVSEVSGSTLIWAVVPWILVLVVYGAVWGIRKRFLVVFSGFVFLLIVGVSWWCFWTPYGRYTMGGSYQGVMLGADFIKEQEPNVQARKLSHKEVWGLEAVLPAYIAAHSNAFGSVIPAQLGRYRRTYWGETQAGTNMIHVLFRHETHLTRHEWLRQFPHGYYLDFLSSDDKVWYIRYDIGSGVFTNLASSSQVRQKL